MEWQVLFHVEWQVLFHVEWQVLFHDEFESEFYELPEEVQDELLAYVKLIERFGYNLRRPHADTLNGSRHANMKERCDPAPTKGARERAPRRFVLKLPMEFGE